jgi:phosphate transport system protein
MSRHFHEELAELNNDILKMGTLAEEAVAKSIAALKDRDVDAAQALIDNDNCIDEMELMIDEKCLDLIARQQPMAVDLRFITTGMRLNNELECIADLAVDIAQHVIEMADQPLLKPLVDIPRLAAVAQKMVKMSIDSFIARDIEIAKQVLVMEPEADALRDAIHKELVETYIAKDPSTAPRAIQLLLIARFLERVCDHASYIAEDVVYMVKAEVVKHHPERL